jgi:ring-1,2-phenylacetyl-CoA epoxidase subunit PaaC
VTVAPDPNRGQLFAYVLSLGDDAMVLGQRLCEWTSNAPFLEEDIALANTALDYIGRARMFYLYAAELDEAGRNEDELAFMRDPRAFRNRLIHELPRGDFAFTMGRQLAVDLFNCAYLDALAHSGDTRLAAIAAKAIKESRYHLRRSREWVLRLGDGTSESHRRMQEALDALWGYTHELFQPVESEAALVEAGIAVDPAVLKEDWDRSISMIIEAANLERPVDGWVIDGGRDGIHTEHLDLMLAEMQSLPRSYPGLEW